MFQLEKISVKNFRVFGNLSDFEVLPINILTGCNNSGKSSLLKGILLLMENFTQNNFDTIYFDGILSNLGSFKHVINNDINPIIFELQINNKKFDHPFYPEKLLLHFEYLKNPYNEDQGKAVNIYIEEINKDKKKSKRVFEFRYSTDFRNINCYINFKYLLNKNEEKPFFPFQTHDNRKLPTKAIDGELIPGETWGKIKTMIIKKESILTTLRQKGFTNLDSEDFLNELNEFVLDLFSNFSMNENNWNSNDSVLYQNFSVFGDWNSLNIKILLRRFFNYYDRFSKVTLLDVISNGEKGIDLKFDPLVKEINSPIIDLISQDFISLHYFFYERTADLFNELNTLFSNIVYLSPLRLESARLYRQSSDVFTFHGVLSMISRNNFKLEADQDKFKQKWLKNFKIGAIDPEHTGGIGNQIFVTVNSKKIALVDMGRGIAQIISFILQLVYTCEIKENSRNEKIFLIEEPESNLHPNLQSLLAELILDAIVVFNVKFFIESHSEYLIRRFQLLTAQGKLSKKQLTIYYLFPPEAIPKNERQVRIIKVENDGCLSKSFGTGFLDEADNIALQIFSFKKGQRN